MFNLQSEGVGTGGIVRRAAAPSFNADTTLPDDSLAVARPSAAAGVALRRLPLNC